MSDETPVDLLGLGWGGDSAEWVEVAEIDEYDSVVEEEVVVEVLMDLRSPREGPWVDQSCSFC